MKPTGTVIYQGPSKLDGAPIVGIVTFESSNSKTGDMLQLWILADGQKPTESAKSGADSSVCGNCPLRWHTVSAGDMACYVNIGQAPNAVYRTWKSGRYASGADCIPTGKPIRLGAYGDPAALPPAILAAVTAGRRWTGYSHQWRTIDTSNHCMASVGNLAEKKAAQAAGYRTFRTRRPDEPLELDEIACPASEEQGFRTTCANCKLCSGASIKAKSIAIVAHGARKGF